MAAMPTAGEMVPPQQDSANPEPKPIMTFDEQRLLELLLHANQLPETPASAEASSRGELSASNRDVRLIVETKTDSARRVHISELVNPPEDQSTEEVYTAEQVFADARSGAGSEASSSPVQSAGPPPSPRLGTKALSALPSSESPSTNDGGHPEQPPAEATAERGRSREQSKPLSSTHAKSSTSKSGKKRSHRHGSKSRSSSTDSSSSSSSKKGHKKAKTHHHHHHRNHVPAPHYPLNNPLNNQEPQKPYTSGSVYNKIQDVRFHNKLTISGKTLDETKQLIAKREFYVPFDPDDNYSAQENGGSRPSLKSGVRMLAPNRHPNPQGRAHLHWYIANRGSAQWAVPLETSPEAWDCRGQKLIPVRDILMKDSGFNSVKQRDLMVHLYLIMYYQHIYEERNAMDPKRAYFRLGGEDYANFGKPEPVILECTFCGQQSDLSWKHIELFKKDEIEQLSKANLERVRKGEGEVPIHIGILSLLTCTNLDCKNSSATSLPKRGAPPHDFYCQYYLMESLKRHHISDMSKIISRPQEFLDIQPEYNLPREKWLTTSTLDEDTIRYLRMEAYITRYLDEYFLSCRVCNESIPYSESVFQSRTKLLGRGKTTKTLKGDLCGRKSGCTWSAARKKAQDYIEASHGRKWLRHCFAERIRRSMKEGHNENPNHKRGNNGPYGGTSYTSTSNTHYTNYNGNNGRMGAVGGGNASHEGWSRYQRLSGGFDQQGPSMYKKKDEGSDDDSSSDGSYSYSDDDDDDEFNDGVQMVTVPRRAELDFYTGKPTPSSRPTAKEEDLEVDMERHTPAGRRGPKLAPMVNTGSGNKTTAFENVVIDWDEDIEMIKDDAEKEKRAAGVKGINVPFSMD
ncbi:hypothetical protein DFH27DRAFT_650565 [Peziza echinospora]|nr:hypothetical protein DFH27DRAFT_650565 [Peziza echinospora]